MDKNNQTYEYIGKLNPDIADYWNLKEHANKPIVIYSDRKQHIIDKHLKDFGSIEKIEMIWTKLNVIIKNPDETFYNEKTKGLEYYKRIDDMIVVAIRINFGSVLKIKSFYPANKNKLNNRNSKKEQMILNGQIDDTKKLKEAILITE